MKPKKKQNKTPRPPKKLPDFSIEDIINAPGPQAPGKRADGLGCNKCGSLRYISTGKVKVFRGQRMVVYHCYGCGQEYYKAE